MSVKIILSKQASFLCQQMIQLPSVISKQMTQMTNLHRTDVTAKQNHNTFGYISLKVFFVCFFMECMSHHNYVLDNETIKSSSLSNLNNIWKDNSLHALKRTFLYTVLFYFWLFCHRCFSICCREQQWNRNFCNRNATRVSKQCQQQLRLYDIQIYTPTH